jgi:hypothetical protein
VNKIELPDKAVGFQSTVLGFGPFTFRILAFFISEALQISYKLLVHVHWPVPRPLILHLAIEVGFLMFRTQIRVAFAIMPLGT